jgi:hypothetical protein
MELKMHKNLMFGAFILAVSSQVAADSYRYEAGLSYLDIEYDLFNGDDFKTSAYFATGVFYFSPVETSNHPLQEASFLERVGSVGIVVAKSTYPASYAASDGSMFVQYELDVDTTSLILSADAYFFNNFFYVGGIVGRSKTETFGYDFSDQSYVRGSEKEDYWRVNLGLAPISGLLIWSEFEEEVDFPDSWNINGKYVIEFSRSALNVQGGAGKGAYTTFQPRYATALPTYASQSITRVNFSGEEEVSSSAYILADYYFNNTLSLGVGSSYSELDFSGSTSHIFESTIRGKKFFSNTFNIYAQLTRLNYGHSSSRISYANLGLFMRF